MKKTELNFKPIPRKKYWCCRKSCYVWYIGVSFNAKDYEFVDIDDNLIYMNRNEVNELCEV